MLVASAYFAGVYTPEYGKRAIDSLLYRNVPVARASFQDPCGLHVETAINRYGEKEAYLRHAKSGKAVFIRSDMSTERLEQRLGKTKSLNSSLAEYTPYDH